MILDQNLVFSDAQAITATAISENVLAFGDLGTVHGEAAAMARDLGRGNPIPLLIQVVEAFATLTSLTITVETSAAAGLTSPVVLMTQTIAVADLTVGRKTFQVVLPDGVSLKYLGLRYTVGGSNATTGKITAALVPGLQNAA